MTIDELVAQEMQPETFEWWGALYKNVTPALVGKPLGDGQALMWFSSMDTRPYKWLIRVDSTARNYDDYQLRRYVSENVINAIADCFGEHDEECSDLSECGCRFPTLVLETGYSFGFCDKEEVTKWQE